MSGVVTRYAAAFWIQGAASFFAAALWATVAAAQSPAPVVTGGVSTLTVFARFADEGRGRGPEAPDYAQRLYDPGIPGSLSHYYLEMSRGQFAVTGRVVADWVTVSGPAQQYVAPQGGYDAFVLEVLQQLDQRLDLGQFDTDGPDGRPNSGDDDGYVDFLFVVTLSAPQGFIRGGATGIAGLGLDSDFDSTDPAHGGGRIRIRSDGHAQGAGGTLQRGHTFAVAVGNMAHELAHVVGLVDLYDPSHLADPEILPAEDSAGIGYWGLMAHGPRGWDEQGGPNPMSAWSLKRLGWLGRANGQLQVVTADLDSAVLADVNAGGTVYQLPIRGELEYLLVEARLRGTSYYERNLPAEGVLIWHIREEQTGNYQEQTKLVDLVCADGLYADGGHGAGSTAAPFDGGDNLDYWAHDETYRRLFGGNLGDATDVFDGVRYTDFWLLSNPAAPSGVSVTGIRRQGDHMVAQLRVQDSRRAGRLTADEAWSGTIDVVGDVTVPAGKRLTLAPSVTVRFGPDSLRSGEDAARSELIVAGELVGPADGRRPARLTSAAPAPRPGDWYGMRFLSPGTIGLQHLELEYPYRGITATASGQGLDLRQVVVRGAATEGIRLERGDRASVLNAVQVHAAGGIGAVFHGSGQVRLEDVHLADNAGGGLVRTGGALICQDSRFTHNGAGVDTAANLTVAANVFGRVERVTFTGGTGLRCLGAREVTVTDNHFAGSRVGVASISALPRITGNTFDAPGLVLQVEGFSAPSRVDLNVVQAARSLVHNRASVPVPAINNWWGSADPVWIAAHMEGDVQWEPFLNFDPRQSEVRFDLAPVYPNPFNGSTRIRYDVGINELVVTGRTRTVLEIRNITGALVRRLVDAPAAPGLFEAVWDGRDQRGREVASGVYYCQLRVGPIVLQRLLTVLR